MGLNPLTWFTSQAGGGYSPVQAAGIVGNGMVESRGRANALGDGGLAYGWAQWHPDRQANFQRVIGRPIQGSSLQDQWRFQTWELSHTEKAAGTALRKQTTLAGATQTVMSKYERPADNSSFGSRLKMAASALAGGGSALGVGREALKSVLGDKAGNMASDVLQGAGQAMLSTVPGGSVIAGITGMGGPSYLEQFKQWLADSKFFERLALAVFAFILLYAAFQLMKAQES